MKLLILADDLTGALDTGIQFASKGARVKVVLDGAASITGVDSSVEVLVVNTESRHKAPKEAYAVVHHIMEQATQMAIPYVYKKTDSALRGHLGAEFEAVLKWAKSGQLHFVPAFPKMNRGTRDGIHYIDGIPVSESVFGKDPFNPVRHNEVHHILKEETDSLIHVVPQGKKANEEKGVFVYDAMTEEDLSAVGNLLKNQGKLAYTAGCAGFASVLADVIGIGGDEKTEIHYEDSFVVACGSVNPITVAQLNYAEKKGFLHFYLTSEEILDPDWITSKAGEEKLRTLEDAIKNHHRVLIDTNDQKGHEPAIKYAARAGLTLQDVQNRISHTMGRLLHILIDRGIRATMMITGGDTLMGFMKDVHVAEMTPVKELIAGSVLSTVNVDGMPINVISKSGGFGKENLIAELSAIVLPENK